MIKIPESLSMITLKRRNKNPPPKGGVRWLDSRLWERIKNTLSNKNVNQSINTQSTNEKVLLLKQSPPTIDTNIDGETLYSNNHSESETASETPQLINDMQYMTESIKNIASGIRKMEWHMELMEPTNGVIPSLSIQRKHWKTSIRSNECKSPISQWNHSKSLNIWYH